MSEIESITLELWKPVAIAPFGDNYSVSSLGRVRRDTPEKATYTGRMLTPYIQKSGYGYPYVILFWNGKGKNFRVHKLVAFTFLGTPPGATGRGASDYQIDHINGIKTDNRQENLQWVLPKENMQLASERGHLPTGDRNGSRLHPESRPRGEDHARSKLTADDIRAIRMMAAQGIPQTIIAKQFGIRNTNVCSIINRYTWKHVK